MAHSRLEKIGTIYTRITGLIRAGAMKLEDRPIWYDVYEAFPPLLPPRYDRGAPNIKIRDIFYEEDFILAKVHKKLGNALPAMDLSDSEHLTLSQKIIADSKRLQLEEGLNHDEAFERAYSAISIKISPEQQPVNTVQTEESSLNKRNESPQKIDVKDIFKET